jgi:tetrahydromethanopterin S-methyltransferase subunit G
MFVMLTKKDLQQIEELMDKKFNSFAIIINNSFNDIYKKFDEVGKRFDRIELELSKKADKEDIIRLEGRLFGYSNRLDKLEDDMRIVKTELKLN